MSSVSQKRPHTPDFGDSDSEDELPPSKSLKRSGNDIPLDLKEKLKNLNMWLSELPVKDNFKMAIKTGSEYLTDDTIVIKDDDDDDDDPSKKAAKIANLTELIKRMDNPPKDYPSNSGSSDFDLPFPISPYPRYDGSSARDWNSRYGNSTSSSRQSRPNNFERFSIISNPPTVKDALEILDAKDDVTVPEVDAEDDVTVSEVDAEDDVTVSEVDAEDYVTVPEVDEIQIQSGFKNPSTKHVELQKYYANHNKWFEKYLEESPFYSSPNQHTDVGIGAQAESSSIPVGLPTRDFIENYAKPTGLFAPNYHPMKEESNEE